MSIYQPKISSLKQLSSGKVRDIYSIDKDKILIVTTDRISAFDSSMPTPIPDKGIILNKISEFWMKKVESVLPNHLTGESPEDYVKKNEINEVKDRATVAKKMSPVPVEAVVRGFITGSAWEEYQQTGFVCGLKLPSGLNKGDKLPRPIFTPARKAISGKHDMNITFSQSEQEFGENLMKEIRSKSIALFEIGFDYLKERNIKLLDTKFEFGLDSKKELVLIDEVLTPDSSRYMFNNLNMDKQFLRDYLREINWDTKDSMPNLPKSS
tara:strand:+ start:367 stop:1167 length:801 start_codon:yes stop_codon:yes gene_type:complete